MAEPLAIEISAKDLAGSAFESAMRNIDAMAQSSQQTAKATSEMGGAIEKAAGFLKGAGLVAAIGAAVSQLEKYHVATRQQLAAMADQAEVASMTTDRWQALVFVADQVGVGQEKLSATMARFSVRIGEAAGGSKSAIDAFDKLGVSLLGNERKLRAQPQIGAFDAEGRLAHVDAVLGVAVVDRRGHGAILVIDGPNTA